MTDSTESEGKDRSLLRSSLGYWRAADWETLASVPIDAVSRDPDRGEIASYVATALSILGKNEVAAQTLRKALEWGCRPRRAAEILVAGAHNTCGRIATLCKDDVAARRHFEASLADQTEVASAAADRMVKETAALGLLPQASAAVAASIEKSINEAPAGTKARALYEVLQSQIKALRYELSVAQKRKQLFGAGAARADDKTALAERSVSQLGQDLWALETCGWKRGGYFVEFGATDGLSWSNTYLLEKEFGWTGLLAEPNPAFHEALKAARSATISDACIAGETGSEVEFVFAGEYGGIAEQFDEGAHSARRDAYKRTGAQARLTTVSLHDFLKAHGAPRDIDYVSVDTEGSEYEILKAFPFEQWNVRCWTIEHNYTPNRELIFELMRSKGYDRRESQWDDWYFRP